MKRFLPHIGALWLLASVAASPLAAQEAAGKEALPQAMQIDEPLYREIATELRCPSCEGLSILESQASFSVQMRLEVRRQLQENKDKEQILQFFVERYGSWILRKPPLRGIALVIWVLPAMLALLGVILGIWFFLCRGLSGKPTAKGERGGSGKPTRDELLAELSARVARVRADERRSP